MERFQKDDVLVVVDTMPIGENGTDWMEYANLKLGDIAVAESCTSISGNVCADGGNGKHNRFLQNAKNFVKIGTLLLALVAFASCSSMKKLKTTTKQNVDSVAVVTRDTVSVKKTSDSSHYMDLDDATLTVVYSDTAKYTPDTTKPTSQIVDVIRQTVRAVGGGQRVKSVTITIGRVKSGGDVKNTYDSTSGHDKDSTRLINKTQTFTKTVARSGLAWYIYLIIGIVVLLAVAFLLVKFLEDVSPQSALLAAIKKILPVLFIIICGLRIANAEPKPYRAQMECNRATLLMAMQSEGVAQPGIVLAQIMLETNELKSHIFKTNNNLCGMRPIERRETTALGAKHGYAFYRSWVDCVRDIKLWQKMRRISPLTTTKEYLAKLRTYAEDPNYFSKLKKYGNYIPMCL